MGEKLRGDSAEAKTALGRAGRYHKVAGNLRVKEVRLDDGTARDRFVIAHNPERAERDRAVRAQIVTRLEDKIAGSDRLGARARAELAGKLKTKPAFNRFLRATPAGKLRIDRRAVTRDAFFDGKYLLRSSDESLSATDIAQGYKGPLRSRARLPRRQVHHRPAPRLPPQGRADPGPRPTVLAGGSCAVPVGGYEPVHERWRRARKRMGPRCLRPHSSRVKGAAHRSATACGRP
jgi:hypothetical protein